MKFINFFLFTVVFIATAHAEELSCRIKRNLPGMNHDNYFEFQFNQTNKMHQKWEYSTSFGQFEISAFTLKVPGEDALFPHGYSSIVVSNQQGSIITTLYSGQLNYLSTSNGSFVYLDKNGQHSISFACFYF